MDELRPWTWLYTYSHDLILLLPALPTLSHSRGNARASEWHRWLKKQLQGLCAGMHLHQELRQLERGRTPGEDRVPEDKAWVWGDLCSNSFSPLGM